MRKLARGSRDPDLIRRLLALAEIHDGGTRTDAARIGGVSGCRSCVTGCCGSTPRVSRWPCERQGAGPAPSLLNDHQRQAPRQVVDDGPMPAVHGVVRWRLIDLAHWLFEELQISISKQTLSRELRNMGFRRPRRHAQDEEAAEVFKKASPPSWRKPQHNRLAANR